MIDLHRGLSALSLLLLLSFYINVLPDSWTVFLVVEVVVIVSLALFVIEGGLLLVAALTALGKIDVIYPITSIILGALGMRSIVDRDLFVATMSILVMFVFGYLGGSASPVEKHVEESNGQ